MRKYFLILSLIFQAAGAQNISIPLNTNWQFFYPSDKQWHKATVPGTIHTDLLDNKLIDDPFFGTNETKLQWIDKAGWDYKSSFAVDATTFAKKNIELVFDGLDTYADVYLNKKLILKAENMFRQYRVDVKKLLRRTGNELTIHFYSAQHVVDSIAKKNALVLPDNNRVYARKAQFQFGWDWGPKFVGCGIWKGVRLEGWSDMKITEIRPRVKYAKDSSVVNTYIEVNFEWLFQDNYKLLITTDKLNISRSGERYVFDKEVIEWPRFPHDDRLPFFFGVEFGQKIKTSEYLNTDDDSVKKYYEFTLEVQKDNKTIDSRKYSIEVRDLQLIQQPDRIGTSFYFQLNGKPIFAKGANYIPSDAFLPRLKKADYRKILQSARDANMNMLRVWGGGVYEADEFYDLCDSMGIMVWQDLMFAGGMYPGDDHFFANVKEEIKYQVQRLRSHPCIVLWCGNNEIDEAWHNWGWQGQFKLHGADSAKVWNDYQRLFRDSLQTWINAYDGTRPYVSTSPKNGWGCKESFTEGDSHYWGVWWGLEDWEVFHNKTGRFVSEYGMQSMPNMNTIEKYIAADDRFVKSATVAAHQKASEGFKKLDHYLERYFVDSARLSVLSLAEYTYLTQCLQYYILKNSIAVHRSKAPNTMGTLLWQLNDCWPVASWSITDYSRRPKAAWYAVKEAYRDDLLPKEDSIRPKDIKLAQPHFTLNVDITNHVVTISSDIAAKYVYLSLPAATATFSDNYFDLKPGIAKSVTFTDIEYKPNMGFSLEVEVRSLWDVLHN